MLHDRDSPGIGSFDLTFIILVDRARVLTGRVSVSQPNKDSSGLMVHEAKWRAPAGYVLSLVIID